MKQAVLGATGNIGSLLVDELIRRNVKIKALARNWSDALPTDDIERVTVDAESADDLQAATMDVDVLYVVLSVPYGTEQWQRAWPVIMKNVINAAKANAFKIVFLDNVYMYGRVEGPMTEETPDKPLAKKGAVRAQIAHMLQEAIDRKEVTAVIARSADFYGPHTRISSRFFEGAVNDGVANWIGKSDVLRTWSYTLDNAKALAVLGNDDRANNQIWHMPAAAAMKGTDFIALASKILGKDLQPVLTPVPGTDARTAFEQQLPEIAEMMYQYDYDYIFDSSKFQQTFDIQPTSYEEGFKHVFSSLTEA